MKPIHAYLMGSLSLLALTTTPAMAQAAEENSGGIADIVVTAQKKAENLQSVPISVAAVSSEAVENLHAVTLQGLQGSVPNVEIGNFANTPNTAVFTIRGIGVIEPDPYAGNTVGIVVDGVPQYFSMGALLDLYDVDRIEVLRGPQGTLFGANTTGGVVNVVNKAPEDRLGGKFDLSYGNYHHLTIGGVLNAPLGEGLSARFAVNHDERHGYVTNVVTGKDMGRRNVTIFRGTLRYESGNVEASLTGEYDRARNGSPIVVAGDLPTDAEFVPAGWRGMYASPCLPAGSPCTAPAKYFSAQDGGVLGDTPDKSNMDTYRAGFTLSVKDTPIGDITAISGYKQFKLFEFTDQDGTPAFLIDTRRQTRAWQFSQELRTDFSLGDRINVTMGGFYMTDHYDHYQHLRIDFAGGATYNLANNTYTKGLTGLFQRNLQDQDNHSVSLFAQSYIDLTDKLRLQAGIRYAHEKTQMLASTATSLAAGGVTTFDGTSPTGVPNIDLGTVAPPLGVKSWNNVGWKIGLDYKANDNLMLYGYWARGFKSGGFTGRIGIPQDLGPYNPEGVDTFEAGFKSDWADRRVRLNLSVFQTNYRNMQLAQIYFVGSGASLVQGNTILNAAKSRIRGFESELTLAPVAGLQFTASLAYLDAKYRQFNYLLPSGAIRSLTGERLQNAPKWSGSLGASYETPLAEGIAARFAVNYSFTSEKLLTSILDVARARVQPQHLVNANFDIKLHDRFTVGVWATNLFDQRYINSVFDAPGTLGLTNYAPPRMFGVSLKAEY
ncbi:MAG: TonB-dependent receptor [Sphingomonadales bacterium]|nr:TonB-dependent receptor [Sphingomonadales bacterium]